MPLFHNGDDLVLFVHIPKCGGTAVENSFKNSNWDIGYLNEPKITRYNETPCNPQHFHAELIEELIMPTEHCTDQFTIVRNPYTRLISEFIWQTGRMYHVQQRGFDSDFYLDLEQFTIQRLRSYKTNEVQYRMDTKGFLEKKQSFVFDNHMRPQHHYITDNWNIYWFEEMDTKFWPEISQKYNVQSPGTVNETLDRNVERPTYHKGLNQIFKDLFVEFYYEDCKLFGYNLPF
tara:strand:- start:12581 stop:13276 length:696 start_codon:yes stop_codon:yes gene_type:complete